MHGYRGQLSGFDADTEKQVVNIIGKPIIYIDVAQQGANCIGETEQEECYGKSMIEVIEQYHELARALGISIPGSVNKDKKEMCRAAKQFQHAAEVAQSKGVRALAGYINPARNATSYLANPNDDMVLRMFEELGMPLLHPGLCTAATCQQNYFWEWIPTKELFPNCADDQDFRQCNDRTLYPTDLWLYDHRTTFTFLNEQFRLDFPDPAVVKGQSEYWPIGGGIISYRHAAEILTITAPALEAAERIHPRTSCTRTDVTSLAHAQKGLPPGSYACYDRSFHRQSYFHCPEDDSLSGGAIAGIVVGSVVGLAIVVLVLVKCCRKSRNEKE